VFHLTHLKLQLALVAISQRLHLSSGTRHIVPYTVTYGEHLSFTFICIKRPGMILQSEEKINCTTNQTGIRKCLYHYHYHNQAFSEVQRDPGYLYISRPLTITETGRGERIFPLTSASRPALEPTQPPIKWIPGVLSLGLKHGWGVKLTTHSHVVPRSRMSRSYTSSLQKHLHGVQWDSFSFLTITKSSGKN
jgi:hypothetical protein